MVDEALAGGRAPGGTLYFAPPRAARGALHGRRRVRDRGPLDGAIGTVRRAVAELRAAGRSRGTPRTSKSLPPRPSWSSREPASRSRCSKSGSADASSDERRRACDHRDHLDRVRSRAASRGEARGNRRRESRHRQARRLGGRRGAARGGALDRPTGLSGARRAAARRRGGVRRRPFAGGRANAPSSHDGPTRVPADRARAPRQSPGAERRRGGSTARTDGRARRAAIRRCDCRRPRGCPLAGPARSGSRWEAGGRCSSTAPTTRRVLRLWRHTSGRSGRTGCRWCLAPWATSMRRTCCGRSRRSRSR